MSHSAGLSGWKEPITKDDLYDWEKVTVAARRPGAVLGAGHGARLSRHHPGLSGRRGGPPRSPASSLGTVFREEIAEPLGADFHIGLPASEDRARRRPDPAAAGRRRSATARPDRAAGATCPTIPASTSPRPAPAPGAAPRSRPPAAPATPARSPRSTPSWPMAASPRASASCPRPAAARRWSCRSRATDLILGMPARFGLGFGLAGGVVPLPNPNTHLLGRLWRLAGDHRHGCPHDLRLRDEQDGRHDHRRHARLRPGHGDVGGAVEIGRRMARIYMVRHGKAEAGFGEGMDPGLNALGRSQALRRWR